MVTPDVVGQIDPVCRVEPGLKTGHPNADLTKQGDRLIHLGPRGCLAPSGEPSGGDRLGSPRAEPGGIRCGVGVAASRPGAGSGVLALVFSRSPWMTRMSPSGMRRTSPPAVASSSTLASTLRATATCSGRYSSPR